MQINQNKNIPNNILGKLWRAIIEFNLISDGDKILIGLSGGKDSMFLATLLANIKKYAPVKFEIACFTLNTMFSPNFPQKELQEFCNKLDIPFYYEKIDVTTLWKNKKKTKGNTPCFTCAYFRRAATNRKALELNFNKVALAHHHDDAVETFFMNIFESGQLRTFLPSTYLSKTNLTVIRPLSYYRESEIKSFLHELEINPLKNACPYDGNTKRQEIKELIASLSALNPEIYEHLAAAMRTSDKQELWPKQLSQQILVTNFRDFWNKGKNNKK